MAENGPAASRKAARRHGRGAGGRGRVAHELRAHSVLDLGDQLLAPHELVEEVRRELAAVLLQHWAFDAGQPAVLCQRLRPRERWIQAVARAKC